MPDWQSTLQAGSLGPEGHVRRLPRGAVPHRSIPGSRKLPWTSTVRGRYHELRRLRACRWQTSARLQRHRNSITPRQVEHSVLPMQSFDHLACGWNSNRVGISSCRRWRCCQYCPDRDCIAFARCSSMVPALIYPISVSSLSLVLAEIEDFPLTRLAQTNRCLRKTSCTSDMQEQCLRKLYHTNPL